jgi:hypothetical protein
MPMAMLRCLWLSNKQLQRKDIERRRYEISTLRIFVTAKTQELRRIAAIREKAGAVIKLEAFQSFVSQRVRWILRLF